MKWIKKYKTFEADASHLLLTSETGEKLYGIHDWVEDMKSWEWSRTTHLPVTESTLKKWSDHFIGEGYFEKISNLVDKIFKAFSKVDIHEIEDRMIEVYDEIPSTKEKWIMFCVAYGDVERWNKPNKYKYNGLVTVPRGDAKDRLRIIIHILKDIIFPTLYIGTYPSMLLRQSDESYYVTEPKWKCANFNIDDYQVMGIKAGAEFDSDDSRGRKILIHDSDIKKKKEYSVDKFLDMYTPAIVIEIGNRDTSYQGDMNLSKLESLFDEALESILPNLDYNEVLWDRSRNERHFRDDIQVGEYSVKILLNM